jgi:hypothetical protein
MARIVVFVADLHDVIVRTDTRPGLRRFGIKGLGEQHQSKRGGLAASVADIKCCPNPQTAALSPQ